jgi:CheY-like chemotaxis protein
VAVRLAAEPDGRHAVLAVRDSGVGMEPELRRRLFEPFSQADRSLDRSRGGLGLGLALVKGLAALHGGTVTAASDGPGRGSEFALRLPLVDGEAGAAVPVGAAAAPAARRRVLLIEDNRDAAESLRLLLSLIGHEVAVAHAGPEGVEEARRFRPDVVVCDIGLPGGLDGYGVARALRADPAVAGAYLVALTGYGQEADRRRAREAGFDKHLVKPVEPAALTALVASAPAPRA